jgi:hypothetical protein
LIISYLYCLPDSISFSNIPFDCFTDGSGLKTLRLQNCLSEVSFLNLGFSRESDCLKTITGHISLVIYKTLFHKFFKSEVKYNNTIDPLCFINESQQVLLFLLW